MQILLLTNFNQLYAVIAKEKQGCFDKPTQRGCIPEGWLLYFRDMNERNRVPSLNNTSDSAVTHCLMAVEDLEADLKQKHTTQISEKPLLVLANAPLLTITKTIHCKVRDECVGWLNKAAREVNSVWNYSNELHHKAYHNYHGKRTLLSAFDLNRYVAGCGEVFSHIGIDIAQCVNAELATRCKQFKRSKLRFRKSFAPRKSLGWVPFKVATLVCKSRTEKLIQPLKKRENESSKDFRLRKAQWVEKCNTGMQKKTTHSLVFMGKTIRIHQFDRYLNIRNSAVSVRQGNFAEDSCGNWYLNQTFDIQMASLPALNGKDSYVGIDPGCKTSSTAVGYDSRGKRFVHVLDCSFLKDELDNIKQLQRRGHLKQAKRLHRSVARRRDNAIHQWSRELINLYEHVFFGNAEILPKTNSKKTKKRLRQEQRLKDRQNAKYCTKSKTNKGIQNSNNISLKNNSKTSSSQKPIKQSRKRRGLNRSRLDAAWGKQNQSLQYKGRWTGRTVEKIDEKYTSVSCFRCKSLTGPRGQSMLTVRVWVCSVCDTEHQRDENSSEHIGERGMKIHSLSWQNPSARAEASASIEACSYEQAKREHEQPIQKVG